MPISDSILRSEAPVSSPVSLVAALPEAVCYRELRRHHVILRHDLDHAALEALLPVEHDVGTDDALRELGFVPSSSPVDHAISWRKTIGADLASTAARLVTRFGGTIVLELAPVFGETTNADARPSFWSGTALVPIGGTNRFVLVPAEAEAHAIGPLVARERADYEATEFHPMTE